MRLITYLLIALLFLTGCQNEQKPTSKFAVLNTTQNSLFGPNEETKLIDSFPLALYKTYHVDSLGSFLIDSRFDLIKNQLKSGQTWEDEIVDQMKQHVKEGTTVVDIGAHIGVHTLTLSNLVGDNGKVVAFEPQLKLFSELAMNMRINKRKNVTAYRCALGPTEGEIEMNPSHPGNEGATPIGSGGDKVCMIPLDSLHLDNVSFIKIDVENFEYEVLLGASETIRRNKPIMIIEVMGNTYNPIPDREEKVRRVLNLVGDMGYTINYIPTSWSDWLAIPTTDLLSSESGDSH